MSKKITPPMVGLSRCCKRIYKSIEEHWVEVVEDEALENLQKRHYRDGAMHVVGKRGNTLHERGFNDGTKENSYGEQKNKKRE